MPVCHLRVTASSQQTKSLVLGGGGCVNPHVRITSFERLGEPELCLNPLSMDCVKKIKEMQFEMQELCKNPRPRR